MRQTGFIKVKRNGEKILVNTAAIECVFAVNGKTRITFAGGAIEVDDDYESVENLIYLATCGD